MKTRPAFRYPVGWPLVALLPALAWASLATLGGCPGSGGGAIIEPNTPGPANTTDKSNNGARYVGTAACVQCHAAYAARHDRHAHAHKLTRIQGQPPSYPADTSDGVPSPPAGYRWEDISYVVGGYTGAARFVDLQGYLVTTGGSGVPTQWNLAFGPAAIVAGFASFFAGDPQPKPYDFERFAYHVTGAAAPDPAAPLFQDNRAGMAGTFFEPGVQCEACHGPGGNHFRSLPGSVIVNRAAIYTDVSGAATCGSCHSRPYGAPSTTIQAADGYIRDQSQWAELKASGGHSSFACGVCHDPHAGLTFGDRNVAIRNTCTACHQSQNMAGHGGKVYRRASDGYTEPLTCESCHMPYATREAVSAPVAAVGPVARVGDKRTHIFRISTAEVDYRQFFTPDGAQVRLDAQGRAAVTVDFVCLRCHNDNGLFGLTLPRAAEIAPNVHRFP